MKTLSLMALIGILTSNAIAHASPSLKWAELEVGTIVKLHDDVKIDDTLTLRKGSTLAVNHLNPLDGIQVQQIELKLFPCNSTLDQRNVSMTILDDTYGFEMKQQCQIAFYLEFRDFYKDSYFESEEK